MNKPLILVVEDDSTVRNLITTTLKSNDYRYITAPNGESAIAAATTQQPDIVFLDLQQVSPFCDIDIMALFGPKLAHIKTLINGLHRPVM